MNYLLACAPIATVLALMLGWKWGAHKAGGVGLAVAISAGGMAFGMTPEVLWVSQAKGLLLSIYVLAIMWPALFLFHWLDDLGGIDSAAAALQRLIPDPAVCALLMSWCLSGCFEGVSGFGLPIAIVSPMLVSIGFAPIRAVAAVAIGHSWAVTFGSMGVILQTLVTITGLPPGEMVPWSALLLGLACVGCGVAVSLALGSARDQREPGEPLPGLQAPGWWIRVFIIGVTMALAQFLICMAGLTTLGSFGAGLSGLLVYRLFAQRPPASAPRTAQKRDGLRAALSCYGALASALALLALAPGLRERAERFSWKPEFAQVTTKTGFATPGGGGPAFRPLAHPGFLTALVAVAAGGFRLQHSTQAARKALHASFKKTLDSGTLASLGVLLMVGLASAMDHCGMTLLLAEAASRAAGRAYPVLSPFIGVLGAFATGSNNNSNIMFAGLQKNAAMLLNVSPGVILSAQTAGGSLGSMVAPAKLVIGCSTAGLAGREGLVLRRTVLPMLFIALALGLAALLLARV